MANKANQNKKPVQHSNPTPKPAELKAQDFEPSSEKAEDTSPAYPNSLNEELDELLKKNPRRFFGGCGG
jgi:hypothetical protein